jgi:sugar phosphate isomerase/epimerase
MADIPIGLQLYSVRDQCAEDLPGVLRAVAEMGYDGVEFAGYHDRTAEELRRMLDECGLDVCGTHIGLDALVGDALEETIEFNKALGNRFLIVSWAKRDTREGWLEVAETLNDVAARLRPHGMQTGYHNHAHDFEPVDGDTPWDILFGNTDPDVVMQIDTGNAFHGGADPVPYIERYPGRATTVHLKEYSAAGEKAVIGEGDVPWGEVFELCETVGGTEWYIVEQESYPDEPLACVAQCLQNLRRMGK